MPLAIRKSIKKKPCTNHRGVLLSETSTCTSQRAVLLSETFTCTRRGDNRGATPELSDRPPVMTLLLITTLLFSGLCSLSSCVPRQFHVVKEAKNWTEAQRYCKDEFTDLATIDNMREIKILNSTMNEAGAIKPWIGLKQGSSPKWQWSLADRYFYREDGKEFRKWNSDPPQGMDKNCAVMKGNGEWYNRKCSESKPFICYDGGNSTHTYVLVIDTNKNWADAQRYCRENHTDLASVRNEAENEKIKTILGSYTIAWIGLFRDTWEWSDGSTSSFRHWETGEPNYGNSVDGFCAQITSSGHWNDVPCHNPSNFICYEDKLVLVPENKTWKEAQQYCREHHVDLVSVTSERIQRWVRGRLKEPPVPTCGWACNTPATWASGSETTQRRSATATGPQGE